MLCTLYTLNPANVHFSDLISFFGQAYLPGLAAHNSLKVAATYQTSVGGYKFPAGYAPLSYKSTRLIPRGFSSADIVSNNYTAVSLDYQLPVWYPTGGRSGRVALIYLTTVRSGSVTDDGGRYVRTPTSVRRRPRTDGRNGR